MSNLLFLVSVPFIAACIALAVGTARIPPKYQKSLSLILSWLPLALLIIGYGDWTGSTLNYSWIPSIGINFHLGMDPLSLFFVALTAIMIPVSIIAIPTGKQKYAGFYFALILFLQGVLFILFTAKDLALFTIAWESMLLPLYFIINYWGGPQRHSAAIQFLIYMIAGSCFFVAAVLALYFSSPEKTFELDKLSNSASIGPYAGWIFAAFVLAFAVKTPLFPFHAWLPDAYVEAPFAGTILLSALLSKAGIYGFARIGFGLFPKWMVEYSYPLLILAIIGALYAAITAWTQRSIKSVIAYSSLSHVNFILAGIFAVAPAAFQGAIMQSFNHGITIGALFLVTYWLQQRTDEPTLGIEKGLAKFFPILCWLTLFFVLSSIALPTTNSFVGELLILFGLFTRNVWLATVLALSVILSAIYMLRWMQKIYFEEPKDIWRKETHDIGKKELACAFPLIAAILLMGIYPGPWLKELEPAASKLTYSEKNDNMINIQSQETVFTTKSEPRNIKAQVAMSAGISLNILMPSLNIQNLIAANEFDQFSVVAQSLDSQAQQSTIPQNTNGTYYVPPAPSYNAQEVRQQESRVLETADDRRREEDLIQQNSEDNRRDVEHQLQRAAQNRQEVQNELDRAAQNRRDVDNTLQRERDARRLEENSRLERQRQDSRADDRRAEDRRLERQRENR